MSNKKEAAREAAKNKLLERLELLKKMLGTEPPVLDSLVAHQVLALCQVAALYCGDEFFLALGNQLFPGIRNLAGLCSLCGEEPIPDEYAVGGAVCADCRDKMARAFQHAEAMVALDELDPDQQKKN